MVHPPGLFVTGTDTSVGKTVISCALAVGFRARGSRVGVMKPVATGAEPFPGGWAAEDTLLLQAAAGVDDPLDEITPALFAPPIAPHAAAAREGATIDLPALVAAFRRLSRRHGCMVVEGVGGLLTPLTRDALLADLIAEFGLPLVVVARAGLGTINHALLTLEAARRRGLAVLGVVVNGLNPAGSDLERENVAALAAYGGAPILGQAPRLTTPGGITPDLVVDILESRLSAAWYREMIDAVLAALRRAPGS
ncbi:MAG: dethiobiotin synthase [Planctomycetes bacterium]|nr:dethiobiotin synthase [Planctomycetota bacterium]